MYLPLSLIYFAALLNYCRYQCCFREKISSRIELSFRNRCTVIEKQNIAGRLKIFSQVLFSSRRLNSLHLSSGSFASQFASTSKTPSSGLPFPTLRPPKFSIFSLPLFPFLFPHFFFSFWKNGTDTREGRVIERTGKASNGNALWSTARGVGIGRRGWVPWKSEIEAAVRTGVEVFQARGRNW